MNMNKINIIRLVLTVAMTTQLSAQSIVGAWLIRNAGQAKSDAVITFLANGTYTMAEDGNSTADPNGRDGMERGTYRWNSATGAFSSKTLVDTTGEWGLSNSEFKSVSVSGAKLTLVADDGEFSFSRVTSKRPGIVGSWYLKESGGYAVATFLADGTYFMVQDGPRGGGGKTGMEFGTYKWNPITQSFTRKILLDSNGTWGFSDPLKRSIEISGNKMTMTVQGEGKFTLSRVVAPK
jgi:hypothetical protein